MVGNDVGNSTYKNESNASLGRSDCTSALRLAFGERGKGRKVYEWSESKGFLSIRYLASAIQVNTSMVIWYSEQVDISSKIDNFFEYQGEPGIRGGVLIIDRALSFQLLTRKWVYNNSKLLRYCPGVG